MKTPNFDKIRLQEFWNAERSQYALTLIKLWKATYPDLLRDPTPEELDYFQEEVNDKIEDTE